MSDPLSTFGRLTPSLGGLAVVVTAFGLLRVRWARTRTGGAALATGLAALAVVGAIDPRFRAFFADPGRLMPALVLLGALAALRRAAQREDAVEPTPLASPRELVGAGMLAVGLVVVFALVDASDGPPALIAATRPAWFLLPLRELAVDLPAPWAGLGGLAVGFALLLALPWLALPDVEGEAGRLSPRRPEVFLVLFALVALVLAPLAAGAFFRGPTGEPASPLDPTRPLAIATTPFATAVWRSLGRSPPASWLARETPGLVVLAVWATLLPLWLLRGPGRPGFVRRWRDELDRRRFTATAAFLVFFGWPLLALALRALFGLSPLVGWEAG